MKPKLALPFNTADQMLNPFCGIIAQASDRVIPQCTIFLKLLCMLKSALKLWPNKRMSLQAAVAYVEVLKLRSVPPVETTMAGN